VLGVEDELVSGEFAEELKDKEIHYKGTAQGAAQALRDYPNMADFAERQTEEARTKYEQEKGVVSAIEGLTSIRVQKALEEFFEK
jgi:hypothetical protein